MYETKTLVLTLTREERRRFTEGLDECVEPTTGYAEGRAFVTTWTGGQAFRLCDAEEYWPAVRRWKMNDLPLVPAAFRWLPRTNAAAQLATLERLLRRADVNAVAVATNGDARAALNAWLALRYVGCRLPVYDITIVDGRTACAPRPGFTAYDPVVEITRVASEMEWMIGVNLTRGISLALGRICRLGRTQAGVLKLLAARRRAPVSQDVAGGAVTASLRCEDGTQFEADAEAAHCAREYAADYAGRHGTITAVEERLLHEEPPGLPSMADLQEALCGHGGINGTRVTKAAAALYDKGLISYPWTTGKRLPATYAEAARRMITELEQLDDGWSFWSIEPDENDSRLFTNDLFEPQAVVPTKMPKTALGYDEELVWQYVARRFLAAFHPPATLSATKVETDVAGRRFRAELKGLISPGWRVIDGIETSGLHEGFLLRTGQKVQVTSAWAKKGYDLYSEGELVRAMQELGYGTARNRADIIDGMVSKTGQATRIGTKIDISGEGKAILELIGEEDVLSDEFISVWNEVVTGKGRAGAGEAPVRTLMTESKRHVTAFASRMQKIGRTKGPAPVVSGVQCPDCGAPLARTRTVIYCTGKCGFRIVTTALARLGIAKLRDAWLPRLLDGEEIAVKDLKTGGGHSFDAKINLVKEGGRWRVNIDRLHDGKTKDEGAL